jgi:hypothetical protein
VKKHVDISSLPPALPLIAAMAMLNFAATAQNFVDAKSQLMLGIAPDKTGLMLHRDLRRLEQVEAAIRERYAKNLITKENIRNVSTEAAFDGGPATFWSAPVG